MDIAVEGNSRRPKYRAPSDAASVPGLGHAVPVSTPADVRLRAAAVAATVMATAEIAVVAALADLRPPLRVTLALVWGLQYLLAWRLLHRSAGAVLFLVLFQVTALLVAAGARDWHGAVRAVLALGAVVTAVLVVRAAGAIPSPALPPRISGRAR
jgi:hypothetical protein